MKIIFLDIDGVLNSDRSLMSDDSLEEDLILNLKELVDKTNAKIVLSSTWRLFFSSIKRIMDRFAAVDLTLYGVTPNGVSIKWLQKQGFTPTPRYLDTIDDASGKEIEITTDRGAEILKWLSTRDVESFVILDDDIYDIERYCPNNIVKTNFSTGLTKADVQAALKILKE